LGSRKRLCWCLIVGIVLISSSVSARCAQGEVGISTFVLDFGISPGETAIDAVTIVNSSNVPQTVTIEPVDWVPVGSGTQNYLPPGTLDRSLASWLSFWPSEATIEPGESVEVQVELSTPARAEGCYWGMLFVKLAGSASPGGADETSSAVGMQVILGVAVYADCGGGQPQGRIVNFLSAPADPVRQLLFILEFEDTGITRLDPTGRIDIIDANGLTVRQLPLSEFVSLPGTRQKLEMPLTRPPTDAVRPEGTAFEGDPPLPPGRYLAIAIIDYGGDALVGAQLPFEIQDEESD